MATNLGEGELRKEKLFRVHCTSNYNDIAPGGTFLLLHPELANVAA